MFRILDPHSGPYLVRSGHGGCTRTEVVNITGFSATAEKDLLVGPPRSDVAIVRHGSILHFRDHRLCAKPWVGYHVDVVGIPTGNLEGRLRGG